MSNGLHHQERDLLDLSSAIVVSPEGLSRPERNALSMLCDEVEKRTGIRLEIAHQWPRSDRPVICVVPATQLSSFVGTRAKGAIDSAGSEGPEGFQLVIETSGEGATVFVVGNDARGVLFGIGRLLQEMRMTRGKITVPADLDLTTSPAYSMRGHQLGYRPKTNSYCGWDLPQWEQYIRDLVIFGCNAIELIPPRSDDIADCPHFPRPQLEMMIGMSELADACGIDVWIWYPALDKDYGDAATVASALEEWGEIFRALPRIDEVFVPGGDPGHTPPRHLMNLLEKQTVVLHQSHPNAGMWVSPQGFTQAWYDDWVRIMQDDRPKWLTGVVFAPQTRVDIEEFRRVVPREYPVRNYPDITHTLRCQYPVQEWDCAFALTAGREPINPRPRDQVAIFNYVQPHAYGFLTYSEGCNDDVNKFIWSVLGWNPDTPVEDIILAYSRVFIGDEQAPEFARGLFGLENNWKVRAAENDQVDRTLELFRKLEAAASEELKGNWRFQQALYRAYYDAYVCHRFRFETNLEEEALQVLRRAPDGDSLSAVAEAEEILQRPMDDPEVLSWKKRVFELAEDLFQSIRMQLSVELYQAVEVHRGANLDGIDFPLSNRLWLESEFGKIRQLKTEQERLSAIESVVNWTEPGEGSFYDDLGDTARQPHLVKGPGFDSDPSFLKSALDGFEVVTDLNHKKMKVVDGYRTSWRTRGQTFYETPLVMEYGNLDPSAHYRLKVVYGADVEKPFPKIRLESGSHIEIHPFMDRPVPFRPLEFDLPAEACADGKLTLNWIAEPGYGGNGHGVHVAEVWVLKKKSRQDPVARAPN
jgi:hypothetical protein